jgi:hypothetical protein
MKNRCLAVMSVVTVAAGLWLAPVLVAGQTAAKAPKAAVAATAAAPRSEPDLEGIWYAFEDVPLQRPAEYAGREFLTDQEMAARARKAWIERVAEGFNDPDKRQGRDHRQEIGTAADVAGAYNALWTPGRDDRKPSNRTSLIVDPPDGKIPPLTPEAQKRAAAFQEYQQMLMQGTPKGRSGPLSPTRAEAPPIYNTARLNRPSQGPEDRSRTERCLGLSLPAFGGRIYHRIVQSPGYVAIYYEPSGHSGANRVIPVGETRQVPLPQHIRQYLGDPRGRWEGKTLVVETTNFTQKTDYQGSRENLRLTERFTRINADTIRYEVTVQDPTTWTKPWTIRADMAKQNEYENRLYEPSCHEGNYGLIGILSSFRAEDQAFREGRGPDPALQDITLQDEAPGTSGE